MSRKRKRESRIPSSNGSEIDKFKSPSGVKRSRIFTEKDAAIAQLFNDLSSNDKADRLEAAAQLVSKATGDFTSLYVRLIRGLCSSRKSARLGFFTAMTELLAQDPKLKQENRFQTQFEELISLIQTHTEPEGKNTGQEKRDYFIGRGAALNSILHSRILFQHQTADCLYCFRLVIEEQCKLVKLATWLREQCFVSMYETVRMITELGDRRGSQLAASLLEILNDYRFAKTLEGAAIWLEVLESFPNANLPGKIWPKDNVLASKSLPKLSEIIKGISKETPTGISGSRQVSPSFSWKVILEHAMHREKMRLSTKDCTRGQIFEMVWGELVDKTLFANAASAERKSIGLQVLSNFISTAPTLFLQQLFTANVVRCLINQSSESERYLHSTAKATLRTLVSRVKQNTECAPAIYVGLMSNGDCAAFDKLSGTKTVQDMFLLADETSFSIIVTKCFQIALQPNTTEENVAESRRQVLADQMLHALRARSADSSGPKDPKAIGFPQILSALAMFAYLTSVDDSNMKPFPKFSTKTRTMYKSRMMSCMTVAMNVMPEQVLSLSSDLLKILRDGRDGWMPDFNADKKVQEILNQGQTILREASESKILESRRRALKSFISITLVHAYSGDSEAVNLLKDLNDCSIRLVDKANANNDSTAQVMDFILEFASRPSSIHRKLAESAFTTFCSSLTKDDLKSMLDILKQGENLAGQEAIFDQSDLNGDDNIQTEDDSNAEPEEPSSVASAENILINDDDHDDKDCSPDTSHEEDGESSVADDDEESNAAELEEFDKKLAALLKTKLPTDEIQTSSVSSSEDMDDEQMMAMDPSIERHFKELKAATNQKKVKADAKQNMINFKNRVLDLLLLYVKRQHSDALALCLILPLLELVRSTQNPALAQKSSQLLHHYYELCKRHGLPVTVELGEGFKIMEALHSEARQNASKLHGIACSSACLFMCRVLIARNPSNFQQIGDLYMTSLGDKTLKLPRALYYTDFINWAFNSDLT